MSGLPRITIITPSFNQGEYLEEAILSVLFQRYPNLEYIVLDGGSTDNSVAVLEKFAPYLSHWESGPDGGQAKAVAKGYSMATGDIVAFLNSDDVLIPGALDEIANKFLEGEHIRWVTGDCIRFGDREDQPRMRVEIPTDRAGWLLRCSIYQPSTFLRRSVIEKFGPPADWLRFSHDFEYWVRLAFGGESCHYVPRVLSGFRVHPGSVTASQREKAEAEDRAIRERYMPQLTAAERRKLERLMRLDSVAPLFHHSKLALDQGDRARARALFADAVRKSPASLLSRNGLNALRKLLF